jgi:hypothetical protein
MTVGGYVCGVAVMPLSYVLLYMPVRAARKAYRLQRRRKRVRRDEPSL